MCGSDGRTYANECTMRAAAYGKKEAIIAVIYRKCPSKDDAAPCGKMCPATYKPVCGSNGRLYENECLMRYALCKSGKAITATRQAKVTGDNCKKCHHACPRIYEPVCSQTGKSFNNDCLIKSYTCEHEVAMISVYKGKCRE